MPTDLKTGAVILFDTITNTLRHPDYQRTKDVAEDFTIYATGAGVESKLRQFNGRETEEAFAQRKALTQVNTPDIFNSCIKPMSKIGRAPANIRTEWKGVDEKTKTNELRKQLFEAGKNFWGEMDVTQYVAQRMVDLDSMDPNSFVVVEFAEDVDPANPKTLPNPYPFEVNSAEAINYKYKNNILQWLIVLNGDVMVDGKGKEHPAEKYYCYLDKEAITAKQVHADAVDGLLQAGMQKIDGELGDMALQPKTEYLFITNDKSVKKKRYFIVRVTIHDIGFVPARRFGTTFDPTTRNRTTVPLVYPARSYFEKSIKTMSEFDLTNCLHVFPQKLTYGDPCPGEPTENGFIGCQSGYRPDGKTLCGSCKGSGFKEHTSAQDIIRIRMPKDLKDVVSLENLIAYKHPPIDLLEFQKQFGFDELRSYAQGAVYNGDVFNRQEVAKTATEKTIDLDAVYDTLYPFAQSWSAMFTHIYKCIARLRNISTEKQELVLIHEFPKDFKMQSLTALLDDLKKATENGAPSHIKKAISRDITRKIYADSPHEQLKIETKDKFFPFPGKSESEIAYILANNLTTKFLKIFYAHFDLIFSELESDAKAQQKDFYEMEETMQRALIDAKVEEYLQEVDTEVKEAQAEAFKAAEQQQGGADTGGEELDEEEEAA